MNYPTPRTMINNSRQWAIERDLMQINEVHKEEEWRIPVSKTFQFETTKGERVKRVASGDLEDPSQQYRSVTLVSQHACPFSVHKMRIPMARCYRGMQA